MAAAGRNAAAEAARSTAYKSLGVEIWKTSNFIEIFILKIKIENWDWDRDIFAPALWPA